MKFDFIIKNKFLLGCISVVILLLAFFFDKSLCVALLLLLFLSAITFFIFYKVGFRDKRIYLLFLIVLVIRFSATLFMHYTDFQPFSGHAGDYFTYQNSAVTISKNFQQGNFSIKNISLQNPDLYTDNYYPVFLGVIYALTLPKELIGIMLNVWLAAVSICFVYLIVLEIDGSKKSAFLVGIISAIYPSYIFDSGLLLKDALEINFVILGLFFLIKTIKRYAWYNFLLLYLSFICATHFRFYIGYALIMTFIISWFLFSGIIFRRRIIYGIIFIILLGFIPETAYNQGYYGVESFRAYLNPKTINFYRNEAYFPIKSVSADKESGEINLPISTLSVGKNSSFVVRNNAVGYLESFAYVLLGPLPWQIKSVWQLLALAETIPWYFILIFIVYGMIFLVKKGIKAAAPLLIFSFVAMGVIAVFETNLGIIVRTRIPIFISLLCIGGLGFNNDNIIYKYFKKNYEKVLDYWRSRFYRFKHS